MGQFTLTDGELNNYLKREILALLLRGPAFNSKCVLIQEKITVLHLLKRNHPLKGPTKWRNGESSQNMGFCYLS